MIDLVSRFVLPSAFAVLPSYMQSREASALLLAIGLQESRFRDRRQKDFGPARGFWQFEKHGGIKGVSTHAATRDLLGDALQKLRYAKLIGNIDELYYVVEDNDVVAAVFARLLLWTVPKQLAKETDPNGGWLQYVEGWRPGKPHPDTWDANFAEAWRWVRMTQP